ncbi:MAG TPA: hypothetical protein VF021_02975, partial [Longimicrobiales bacterium]
MRIPRRRSDVWLPALLFSMLPTAARAQGTLDDYRRAATIVERFSDLSTDVIQGGVNWIGNSNRFWYRVTATGGSRFMLVDANAWQKQPAFDHDRVARALSTAAGKPYTALTLPFTSFVYADQNQAIEFDANDSHYRCTLADYACTRMGAARDTTAGRGRFGQPLRGASVAR